jgi:hypothetical protein
VYRSVRARIVGVTINRQAGMIMDGRISVLIGRRIISGDQIQIVVYGLLVIRKVHGEAISWAIDGEIMKDNGWRRD